MGSGEKDFQQNYASFLGDFHQALILSVLITSAMLILPNSLFQCSRLHNVKNKKSITYERRAASPSSR